MDLNATNTLTTVGAVGGIIYGIKQQKGFWATAGYTLLFALVGTALATAIGQKN
jgi:ABC-type nitrate/sulfonate/bicarbonate transport system permease component